MRAFKLTNARAYNVAGSMLGDICMYVINLVNNMDKQKGGFPRNNLSLCTETFAQNNAPGEIKRF